MKGLCFLKVAVSRIVAVCVNVLVDVVGHVVGAMDADVVAIRCTNITGLG